MMPKSSDGDRRDKARVERARQAAQRRKTRRHKLTTRQRDSEKADAAVERLSASLATPDRTGKE
jgi:hypothetical protein